jgi:hypothetical protein
VEDLPAAKVRDYHVPVDFPFAEGRFGAVPEVFARLDWSGKNDVAASPTPARAVPTWFSGVVLTGMSVNAAAIQQRFALFRHDIHLRFPQPATEGPGRQR